MRFNAVVTRLDAAKQVVQHSGTRGTLAEGVLIEIMRELLPQRYGVGGGFIATPPPSATISPQIDVMVYDLLETAPIYRDAAFAVVTPDMPVILTESKADLDGRALAEAISNLHAAKQLTPDAHAIAFGFSGVKSAAAEQHIREQMPAVPGPLRWDTYMNLTDDYVIQMDRNDSRLYALSEGPGVVAATLTQLVVNAAQVDNLRPYLTGLSIAGGATRQFRL